MTQATAMPPQLYLASGSPRRQELLQQAGIGFHQLVLRDEAGAKPDVDESVLPDEAPEAYVQRVCLLKLQFGWSQLPLRGLPPLPVLAADTTVCLGRHIFGKPADADDAVRMLRELAGKEHQVLTAVALHTAHGVHSALSRNRVRLASLSESEIQAYVDTGEPMGKAGSYGIQGRAACFITELHGSYSGVMGLPLYETTQLLRHIRHGAAQ
jgi:septum formation protein